MQCIDKQTVERMAFDEVQFLVHDGRQTDWENASSSPLAHCRMRLRCTWKIVHFARYRCRHKAFPQAFSSLQKTFLLSSTDERNIRKAKKACWCTCSGLTAPGIAGHASDQKTSFGGISSGDTIQDLLQTSSRGRVAVAGLVCLDVGTLMSVDAT